MRIWLGLMLSLALAAPAHAQNLAGTWQETTGEQKHVLKIIKSQDGTFHGDWYLRDTGATAYPLLEIVINRPNIKFDLASTTGTFDGLIASDGKSMTGKWQAANGIQTLTLVRVSKPIAWTINSSPHKVLFFPVEKDVRLEVLDWGGEGQPLVLLAGLGDNAHVFDTFAPKFTGKHHVYAITRRGFGASSVPPPTDENYDADRLGDDVLAVIDALGLNRPILAGHSIAGEELSSIGSRHPEKVAGLIYLEAAYEFAYYSPNASHNFRVEGAVVRRDLKELPLANPERFRTLIQEIQALLPRLQKSLQFAYDTREGDDWPPPVRTRQFMVSQAIESNVRMYTDIKVPALVISAYPQPCGVPCPSGTKIWDEGERQQIEAIKAGMPMAKVVVIPNAKHQVYRSNEADVLREMNAFMDGLK